MASKSDTAPEEEPGRLESGAVLSGSSTPTQTPPPGPDIQRLGRERPSVLPSALAESGFVFTVVARMMMSDPEYILIDEPGAGLAPVFVEEVYGEIAALAGQGKAILLVDQNVRKAVSLADYVYVLELGKNSEQGPPAQFEQDLSGVVRKWLRLDS
jgi:ABC-type histidine transport system ATPase subunit